MAEGKKTGVFIALGCGAIGCLGLLAVAGGSVAYFAAERDAQEADGADEADTDSSTPAPSRPPEVSTPTSVGPSVPEGFVEVSGTGFTYAVPSDWVEAAVSAPALVAHRAPTPVADFYPNVNLTSEPFAGDAVHFGRLNVDQLKLVAEVVRKETGSLGGQPMLEVEAVWPANEPPTQTLQRFLTHEDVGFVITCTTAAGHLDTSRAQCLAILDTLRLH